MINFWLRPKTTTSPRCITCFSVGGRAAGQRPRVPAAPWRLQFKHLTTLFYSSIIATAAAVDVRAKQARREQWIVAIGEVERFLQEVKDKAGPADSAAEYDAEDTRAKEDDDLAEEYVDQSQVAADMDRGDLVSGGGQPAITTGRLRELSEELKRGLGRRQRLHHWQEKLPRVGERNRVAPQSLYATESRRLARPYHWTQKKLLTTELAVAKFTTRLLLDLTPEHGEIGELTHTNSSHSTAALERKKLEQRLETTISRHEKAKEIDADNTEGVEGVHYPRYDPEVNPGDVAAGELNKAMLRIFRNYAAGTMLRNEMLAKISYNLLVSQTPPNLITWTILISRFSRLRQNHLVDMVLDAVEDAHVRPNEMTVATTLAHYVRTKDPRGYERYIQKLEGYHGGLMLARDDLDVSGVGASRLRRWKDKVIQGVTFDAHVYYSVIAGFLQFHNFFAAMLWYRRMLRDGFKADLQLLIQFLRHFSFTQDWERGLGIWKNIKAHFLRDEESQIDLNDPQEVQSAFYFMLRLCRICQEYGQFRTIYKEGLDRGYTMDMLLLGQSISRGFSHAEDVTERLRRNVRIVEHRALLLSLDLRKWGVQSLASKIILSGLDIKVVHAVFDKHAVENAYEEWLSERPWLYLRKVRSRTSSRKLERR